MSEPERWRLILKVQKTVVALPKEVRAERERITQYLEGLGWKVEVLLSAPIGKGDGS